MANEDKNKKRSITEFLEGEKLSKAQAKKRKNPNDPEVRELERKNVIEGKINRSMYLYEPYARYERSENPHYKRHRDYSLAGILAGAGMLVTGFASLNYTLAYAGAALTIASLGYHSGHWYRKHVTDSRFEKVSGLEKKVQEPDNLDSPSPSNHEGSLSDITAKEAEKDEALYVRRTHKSYIEGRGGYSSPMRYYSLTEPLPRDFHRYSGPGTTGILLTGVMTFFLSAEYIKGGGCVPALYWLYAAGATSLATLGHYVGFIFGKKLAKPEYQKA